MTQHLPGGGDSRANPHGSGHCLAVERVLDVAVDPQGKARTRMTNHDLTNAIVAAVAKGLTPAMRQALLWLPDDGSWREADASVRPASLQDVSVCEGVEAHLTVYDEDAWRDMWCATKFGLSVRAVVEKMEREEAV